MSSSQVAAIIPALAGQPAAALESVRRQRPPPAEVEVVAGVRPNGRARNIGVRRTTGDILVFLDDDARLGHPRVLRWLVEPLLGDPSIGATGASRLLPPEASLFEQWAAAEVARIEHSIVRQPVESNPEPQNGYYCELTTTCAAMRREVFDQMGGFRDDLVRGVDTEFFVRLRRAGYRLVLVPGTWAWHPAPATLRGLLRKHFLYGTGHAQEVALDPSRGRPLPTPAGQLAYLLFRTAILLPNIFIPYSGAYRSWRPGFKPLKALTSYASGLGYVWGWHQG